MSRYEDVLHVFKNPKLFSSEGLRLAADPPWFGRSNPLADSLVFMDDPKTHGRLRGLVKRAFGPTALARLEPRIRAVAEDLTTRVLQRRTVDFVDEFALPLPASVIGALLGLDPALNSRFKQWSDDIVAISIAQPGDIALLEQCRRTVAEMEQYLGEVLKSRRQAPGEDMVSDLLQARVEGEALAEKVLLQGVGQAAGYVRSSPVLALPCGASPAAEKPLHRAEGWEPCFCCLHTRSRLLLTCLGTLPDHDRRPEGPDVMWT